MRSTKPHIKRWKWGSANSAWVVDGLRNERGRRVRKFFPSQDAARLWLAQRRPEITNQGRSAISLTDRERVDAHEALSILRPFAATLTQAARQFAERARLLSRTVSFLELRTELVAAKRADRKSSVYVKDLDHRLAVAGKEFDATPVSTIETRQLDDWLRNLPLSPVSRANYRKVLRTAFEFAVARGYARENPVTRTATVKVEHGEPEILNPADIDALLHAADPSIVPSLSIAAFAGLRDAEIGRLRWEHIDLMSGVIKVGAGIAKTSSRRIVPIQDNLRAWLMPHYKASGAIRPSFRAYYERARAARLLAAESLRKLGLPTDKMERWPNNALRHSYASYRMAIVGNPALVAEECGHSVTVMKTHYRELVSKREADGWFSIAPAQDRAKLFRFRSPA